MLPPLRIAFGRFSHETNALSPVPTRREAFERFHLRVGDDLRACVRPWRRETGQLMLYNAELSGLWAAAAASPGVELVPLLSAWAIPSGKLDHPTWSELCDDLLRRLRAAGSVDGVFLVLHGAMGVQGEPEPEAVLLERVRAEVGTAVPIAVVFDLHAILTPRKLAPIDLVYAYRTNPHRDHFGIGRVAGTGLIEAIRSGRRPHLAWRSLPMVMGGSPTLDFIAPMRDIFRFLRNAERQGRVAHCALFQNQLWHDAPEASWAVSVMAHDAAAAEAVADEIADRLWAVRHHLPPEVPTVLDAIDAARRAWLPRRLGCVCLSDASDMVGAGSVGENTAVLAALLAHAQDLRCYVPIRDAEVVGTLWDSEPGQPVRIEVGGKLAPAWYRPLPVEGRFVRAADTGLWGRAVVLDLGHVQLVVTEHAPLASGPAFYRDVGLHPSRADLCVVKSLFMFRLYFVTHNRLSLYARTAGMTDFDVYERLHYDQPVHPRDEVAGWRHADRRRRGH